MKENVREDKSSKRNLKLINGRSNVTRANDTKGKKYRKEKCKKRR